MGMTEINKIVGDNLTALRKERGLTQLALAEKFNYTDKSVSKWEKGESLPSIEVLKQLADFYGVTLDYLTETKHEDTKLKNHKIVPRTNKIVLSCLSVCGVFLLATLVYVMLKIFAKVDYWLTFVWAVPVSAIVIVVFSALWGKKWQLIASISVLVWSILASIYLQCLSYNPWQLFLLGVPAQVVIVLCFTIKKKKVDSLLDSKEQKK